MTQYNPPPPNPGPNYNPNYNPQWQNPNFNPNFNPSANPDFNFDPNARPYWMPPLSRRPGAVTALAVIGIVLGSFRLLGSLCGLIPYLAAMNGPNPMVDLVRHDSILYNEFIITLVLNTLLAILLLVGSIAALGLRPTGRALLILCAVLLLFLVPVQQIFDAVELYPKMLSLQRRYPTMGPVAMSSIGGEVVGGAIWFAYGLLVLIFMLQKKVKDAFELKPKPALQPYPPMSPPPAGPAY